MTQTSPSPGRNRLLASLSSDDLALLQPDLDPVSLELRQVLETANEPITHNYFIDHGLLRLSPATEITGGESKSDSWASRA